MGVPLLIGLGLGAAGLGVSEYANNREQKNMEGLAQSELQRQRQFGQQGQQVFNQSLSQATPQAAMHRIGQGQQQALQNIQNVQAAPLSAMMPSFGNVNTMQESARRGMSNQASANLQGYSNYPLQQWLKNINAQNQLGLISNQAYQSEAVLPYELAQAQNSESGLQALGSLLNTGGLLTGLYGLTQTPAAMRFSPQVGGGAFSTNTPLTF